MKTNKVDIRVLKSKHRLELVMQEAGEVFEADAEHSEQWHSKITPGLTVDIHRQLYEIKKPGMDAETGDVLAWLQLRYTWKFAMAIKFLQNRPPDPIQETQPVKVKKTKQPQPRQNDYVIISNYHVNPITGAESYGMDFNYSIMDDLQKRALDLWHDAYKYFDKSSNEVWGKIQDYPKRFKPMVDFDIDECANCKKRFNYKELGAIAYAEEKAEYVEVYLTGDIDDIDIGAELSVDELLIDQDFVICEQCLREIYAPHYAALKLVYRSARRRKEAYEEERKEERRQFELEREEEEEREQERLNYESYLKSESP